MDKETYNSLAVVLEYLLADERKHWQELGRPKDHIYIHVRRLMAWADEVRKDYVDE